MTNSCKTLVDAYIRWLRKNITTANIDGVCEITTPFLDRHNDHLQIFVRKENGSLVLTDDAYVISDLRMSGCDIDTPRRQQFLNSVLAGFGVTVDGEELTTRAQMTDFPQKKHALIQAMLAVSDLFATAQSYVKSLFIEDVAQFLDAASVRYTPGVQFTGKSGFMHKFDFAIPKSQQAPERLVRAVNQPTKDSATSVMFSWADIRDLRQEAATMYAFLNDAERTVSSDVVEALKSYEVVPVPWSERAKYASALAA
jgi:Domain of unknown function DUF1829/Domain of unknown function DUF1828